jgi:uncharacterized protein YycO
MSLRTNLLHYSRPLTVAMSKIALPNKKITGQTYFDIKKQVSLIPGLIFLTHTDWELSNWFIPGSWEHAAIMLDNETIVEAVTSGVRKIDLISFLTSKDGVCILKPSFCGLTEMLSAATWAAGMEGLPYDYELCPGDRAFYCSELVFEAYNTSIKGPLPFERTKTMGEYTYSPQNFYDDPKNWPKLYEA